MNVDDYIKKGFETWRGIMEEILHDNNDYATVEDIKQMCLNKEAMIFCNDKSFSVVQVVQNPRAIYLHLLLLGGDMEALLRLEETITKFAHEIGATRYTAVCRKGFERSMKKHGWTSPKIYLEKEIPHGK